MGVSTLRLLLASTHPRSACPPSMRGEPTPGLMMTERSSTKEAGRLSEPNTSSPPGRRSTMNGARDPPGSFPSGSARGPARRRELPRLPRARRRPRPPPPRRRITMRRKRRRSTMRRRNKCHDVPTTFDLQNIYQTKYILDENKSLSIHIPWCPVSTQLMAPHHHHHRHKTTDQVSPSLVSCDFHVGPRPQHLYQYSPCLFCD